MFSNIANVLGEFDGDYLVPSLASDYVLQIYSNVPNPYPNPNVEDNTIGRYDVLLQGINLDALRNGITFAKDVLGFPSANFVGSNSLTFTFFARPYKDEYNKKGYTSFIHFLYKNQLTKSGTLRIKTKAYSLPTIFVYNMRTQKIVYQLHNCRFTFPTFTPNPMSNDIVFYSTIVTFDDYEEFVDDFEEGKEKADSVTFSDVASAIKSGVSKGVKKTKRKIRRAFKKTPKF